MRTYEWDEASVSLRPDGTVVELTRAGRPVLRRLGFEGAALSTAAADPDEFNAEGKSGPVQVALRHSFGQSWQIRLVWFNPGAEGVRPPALRLSLEPGPGYVGWAWCGGVDGRIVLAPDWTLGPPAPAVLELRLESGWLLDGPPAAGGPDARGLLVVHPDLVLRPGERRVLSLRASWVDSLDEVGAGLPAWVPPPDPHPGEPLEITQPDAALEVSRGPRVDATLAGISIAPLPGRHRIRAIGPRGTTQSQVVWSPGLRVRAREATQRLLSAPTVQDGLAAAWLAQRERPAPDVHEALDRLAPRWQDGEGGVLAIALGALEAQRCGELALLERAGELLGAVSSRPGAGFAATRLFAAGVALGQADAAAALLGRVLARLDDVEDPLLAAELGSLARPQPPHEVAGLIAALGAGLPGRPLADDPVRRALLAGALAAAPGTAAANTVQRTKRELLAEADRARIALPWLLLPATA